MTDRSPSLPRRLAVVAALLVPLVVDPFGADTQGLKGLVLALCGGAALLCGALEDLTGDRERPGPFLPETVLLLLTAWAAVSLCWAINTDLAITRVLLLLGMLGVARGVRAIASASGDCRRWLVATLAVGVVAMAVDTAAILRAQQVLPDILAKHASWLFVHNNMAASYVTMLAPIVVALLLGAAGLLGALPWLAVLGGLMLYLGLLRSRAGMLGALLGVCVVGALFLLRRRLQGWRPAGRNWALLGGVLVLAATLLPLSDSVRGAAKDLFYRFISAESFQMNDAFFRPVIWTKTMLMVKDRPLTGVGAGNFVVAFPRFERQLVAKPHAHNDALQVLSELGLPGLFLFLALLGTTLMELLRALRDDRGTHGFIVAAGLAGALCVFVLSGQFEVPFALGATAANLAILVGLTGALRERQPARAPSRRLGRAAAVLTVLIALPTTRMLLLRLPGSCWLARADAAAARGDVDGALSLYGRVAALHTGSYYPEERMGELCLQRGDGEAALQHVQAARRLWPWGADLMEAEGDVNARLNRTDDAVAAYSEAAEYSPTRTSAFFKLVQALDRSGHLQDAIDRLQYRIRSVNDTSIDSVQRLADMWRRRADDLTGNDQIRAWAAARHFYAVLLEEGDAANYWNFNRNFKDLTHRLQQSSGGLPTGWFAVYQDFLQQSSLNMPNTALWTSMDGDGKRLFPGWAESAGPPIRGAWRHR